MTEKKNLFRRVFDAIIEGRSAQAQKHIDDYLQAHNLPRSRKD
jgi:hypothetical protein